MKLQAIIKKCRAKGLWYNNIIGSKVEIEYIDDNPNVENIFWLTESSNDKYKHIIIKFNSTGLGVFKDDIKIITREDKLKRIMK